MVAWSYLFSISGLLSLHWWSEPHQEEVSSQGRMEAEGQIIILLFPMVPVLLAAVFIYCTCQCLRGQTQHQQQGDEHQKDMVDSLEARGREQPDHQLQQIQHQDESTQKSNIITSCRKQDSCQQEQQQQQPLELSRLQAAIEIII